MNKIPIDNIQTLHDIIDHINIGITVLDTHNQVIFWNRFMVKHSGISSSDLIGLMDTEGISFPFQPYPYDKR